SPEKKEPTSREVPNQAFKKERPLSTREIKDFYSANISTLTPALQDETLDRHAPAEISQVKDSADPLLTIAVRCGRGEFADAFSVAGKAFDRYQTIPAYWTLVANCPLKQRNAREALLFYNKALEVSPVYVPALNNIGVLYSRQGQDQKALVAFEKAYKSSRFSKTPRYNLAKTYLTYGLSDEALPILKALLSDSPQAVDLLNSVATAYFLMSDYAQAAHYYQKIPAGLWASAEIGLNYALTLKKLGRGADAAKVFNGVKFPD